MQYALVKMILKRAFVEADSFLEEFLLCFPTDYGGGGEMELYMLFSRNTHSSTSSRVQAKGFAEPPVSSRKKT